MSYDLSRIKDTPLLTYEEEVSLFDKYKNENCLKSAEKIVVAHLRYVASIARQFSRYNIDYDDIFQEGVIGLMKAVKSFDATKGARLCTYATMWIKYEMLNYIERSVGIVRTLTTKTHKKLFYNINKMRDSCGRLSYNDINKLAKELNVSEDDVREVDMRLTNRDLSIDMMLYEYDDNTITLGDTLEHHNDTSYLTLKTLQDESDMLSLALDSLEGREKEIFYARKLVDNPKTLEELSSVYGVSKERIRQIEDKAFKKVQKQVLTN